MKRFFFAVAAIFALLTVSACGTSVGADADHPSSGQSTAQQGDASNNAQSFAKKNDIDISLAQNFEDVLQEMGHEAGVSDIQGWEKTEDWAEGERYKAWWYDMYANEYHYLLLYVKDGEIVSVYNNGDANRELLYERATELTDAEWEQLQAVFEKATGKKLEYRPVYCGEWRDGKQYKTENYAYGQYLIDMDIDGYPHLIVFVQDKTGETGREVVYNRLEDENAPIPTAVVDGGIRIVDDELGEYGKRVQLDSYEYVWYMVPAGKYEATSNVNTCMVYVDKNEIKRNSSGYVEMENVATYRWSYGETITIEVGEDEHLFNVIGADYTLVPVE